MTSDATGNDADPYKNRGNFGMFAYGFRLDPVDLHHGSPEMIDVGVG